MACGGESDDNSSNASSPAQISGFEGVYEDFYEEDGAIDEIYWVIHSTGYISLYDYAGDTYDNFANCYWITHRAMRITNPFGSGNYDLEFLDNGSYQSYGDYDLTVGPSSFNVIAADGKLSLPRSNLLVSDLTPDCDS
jgi:hypothetical protein